MRQAGEIHCYLCGDTSGIWEWPATASPERGIFRPLGDGGPATPGWLKGLRCPRCGGSVYLEGVEPVKRRSPLDPESLKSRRGRPPKSQSLAS